MFLSRCLLFGLAFIGVPFLALFVSESAAAEAISIMPRQVEFEGF